MNHIVRWLFFMSAWCFTNVGLCQFSELKKATNLEYGEMDSPFTWEKQMVGKLDEVFEIFLFLVTDTKSYHGVYQVGQSKDLRYLEGEYDGKIITLFEYNQEGELTGVITGDLNDYIFYGNRTDRMNTEEVSFVVYSNNYKLDEDLSTNWIRSFQDNYNYIHIEKVNDNYLAKCDINGNTFSVILECIEEDCKKYKHSEWVEENEESNILQFEIIDNTLHFTNQDSILLKLPLSNLVRHKNTNRLLGEKTSYVVCPSFNNPKLSKSWDKFMVEYFGEVIKNIPSIEKESSIDIIPDFLSASLYSGIIRYQDNLSSNLKEVGFLIDFNKNKVQSLLSLFPKGYDIGSQVKVAIESIIAENENYLVPNLEDFVIYSLDKNNLILRSKMNLIYGQTVLTIPLDSLPFKILK